MSAVLLSLSLFLVFERSSSTYLCLCFSFLNTRFIFHFCFFSSSSVQFCFYWFCALETQLQVILFCFSFSFFCLKARFVKFFHFFALSSLRFNLVTIKMSQNSIVIEQNSFCQTCFKFLVKDSTFICEKKVEKQILRSLCETSLQLHQNKSKLNRNVFVLFTKLTNKILKNCFVDVRELVRVARDFNFKNILIFEHFSDVIVNVDRVVNKIIAKTKALNSKNKSSVSRLVVHNSNNNDDNNNNDNDDDLFFRLRLTRFNEWMTMIYVANTASNNCLIVIMKDVNVLKRVELLRMTMSIEIVVDREKTTKTKKEKKKKKTKKKTKLTRQKSVDVINVTRHWYIFEKKSIYCERLKNDDENVKMSWIESNLYQEYFKRKTKWNFSNLYII